MTYYGIYKITNKVNGKMYIGQHITDDLDDGYLGSGLVIKNAVKKYGPDSFTKEWLEFAENAEDLNYLERIYVDEEWLARPDTYNLILGGTGGWGYVNAHELGKTEEVRRKKSESMKGKTHSHETKMKISKARKGQKSPMKGKHHSEQARRLMSLARKRRKTTDETKERLSKAHRGSKNAMYGRRHSKESIEKMRQARILYYKNKRRNTK